MKTEIKIDVKVVYAALKFMRRAHDEAVKAGEEGANELGELIDALDDADRIVIEGAN